MSTSFGTTDGRTEKTTLYLAPAAEGGRRAATTREFRRRRETTKEVKVPREGRTDGGAESDKLEKGNKHSVCHADIRTK